MNNELQIIIEEQKLATSSADQLIAAFGAPFTEAGEILTNYQDIVVTEASQVDLIAEAKQKRLKLKKIRTSVESKRKELKEDSLRTGKAIDGVARYIRDTIQPAEEYLELQEKFVERQEEYRRLQLNIERREKLDKVQFDARYYQLDTMTEAEFEKLLREATEADELRNAQAKAYADLLESQRLAREEEETRIRDENALLKKQAETREAEIAEERETEREMHEAELRTEREKVETERAKLEAIEKEQQDKLALEVASADLAKKTAEAGSQAPDRQKIIALGMAIDNTFYHQRPIVKTKAAKTLLNAIEDAVEEIKVIIANGVRDL